MNAAWRAVRRDPSGVTAVHVERLPAGGFLLHTREPAGEFDVWLETEAEVAAALAGYDLDDDEPAALS